MLIMGVSVVLVLELFVTYLFKELLEDINTEIVYSINKYNDVVEEVSEAYSKYTNKRR